MKILIPCPGCQHPLLPPRHATSSAKLRCGRCGHVLNAGTLLVDDEQAAEAWEVIEDSGMGNDVFASLFPTNAAVSGDSAAERSASQDMVEYVPQSNEWETQQTFVGMEEAEDWEVSETQPPSGDSNLIVEELSADGWRTVDRSRRESDGFAPAMPDDEMMSVSDEPWISPTLSAGAGDLQETAPENESAPAESALLQGESEPELQWSDVSDQDELAEGMFESAEDDLNEVEVVDEDVEFKKEEDFQPTLVEDFDEEPVPQPVEPELRARTAQVLPTELLGGSSRVLRSRKKGSPIGMLASVIGGGFAAIPISVILMWYALGKDPLHLGPMVSSVAPWLVPERFRGLAMRQTEKLPEMPPMVGPGFSADPDAPRKLPSIGGEKTSDTTQSTAELPSTEAASDSSAPSPAAETPSTQPLEMIASGTISDTSSVTPTLELSQAPQTSSDAATFAPPRPDLEAAPLAPLPSESPPVAAINETISKGSVGTSSVTALPNELDLSPIIAGREPVEAPSALPAPASESSVENTLAELERAVQMFNPNAIESAAILFRTLEVLGSKLAALPPDAPELTAWREKALTLCQTIAANKSMLQKLKSYVDGGSGSVFPEDEVNQAKIDFLAVESVEKGIESDLWKIKEEFRFQKNSFKARPVVAPHYLGVSAEPQMAFLVVGISEVDPESRQLVFRAVLAAQRK